MKICSSKRVLLRGITVTLLCYGLYSQEATHLVHACRHSLGIWFYMYNLFRTLFWLFYYVFITYVVVTVSFYSVFVLEGILLWFCMPDLEKLDHQLILYRQETDPLWQPYSVKAPIFWGLYAPTDLRSFRINISFSIFLFSQL